MADTNARRSNFSSLDIRYGHDLADVPIDADRRLTMLYVLKHCDTPRGLRWHGPPAMSLIYQESSQVTEQMLAHGYDASQCMIRAVLNPRSRKYAARKFSWPCRRSPTRELFDFSWRESPVSQPLSWSDTILCNELCCSSSFSSHLAICRFCSFTLSAQVAHIS